MSRASTSVAPVVVDTTGVTAVDPTGVAAVDFAGVAATAGEPTGSTRVTASATLFSWQWMVNGSMSLRACPKRILY